MHGHPYWGGSRDISAIGHLDLGNLKKCLFLNKVFPKEKMNKISQNTIEEHVQQHIGRKNEKEKKGKHPKSTNGIRFPEAQKRIKWIRQTG